MIFGIIKEYKWFVVQIQVIYFLLFGACLKKIVYKNTICEHLYNRDTFGYAERNDRKAIVPVSVEEKAPVSTCGCNKCGKKQVLRNRYVIVTEM